MVPAAAPTIRAREGRSMFKAVYLVNRKVDLAFDEFRRYSTETHAPLAQALPGLRGYRLAFYPPSGGTDAPFDSSATLDFDDKSAHDAALVSPEGERALADLSNFLDTTDMIVLFGEEVISRV
jgi:uncharacterized protein (TIGR02118 family)